MNLYGDLCEVCHSRRPDGTYDLFDVETELCAFCGDTEFTDADGTTVVPECITRFKYSHPEE